MKPFFVLSLVEVWHDSEGAVVTDSNPLKGEQCQVTAITERDYYIIKGYESPYCSFAFANLCPAEINGNVYNSIRLDIFNRELKQDCNVLNSLALPDGSSRVIYSFNIQSGTIYFVLCRGFAIYCISQDEVTNCLFDLLKDAECKPGPVPSLPFKKTLFKEVKGTIVKKRLKSELDKWVFKCATAEMEGEQVDIYLRYTSYMNVKAVYIVKGDTIYTRYFGLPEIAETINQYRISKQLPVVFGHNYGPWERFKYYYINLLKKQVVILRKIKNAGCDLHILYDIMDGEYFVRYNSIIVYCSDMNGFTNLDDAVKVVEQIADRIVKHSTPRNNSTTKKDFEQGSYEDVLRRMNNGNLSTFESADDDLYDTPGEGDEWKALRNNDTPPRLAKSFVDVHGILHYKAA